MRLPIFYIPIFFFFCYCSDTYKNKNYNASIDTIQATKIDSTQNKNLTTSSLNFHLTFDSTKTLMANLYNGWMDTFSIDKQKFRLKYDINKKDYDNCCIEHLKNGQWQKLFNLYLCSDEYKIEDINNDGYIDFVKFYHARHYIYFYNPSVKNLIDSACIMPEDITVIDKEKFILYNKYEAMYGNIYQSSQLYTYKQRQPYFFYKLLLITNDSNNIEKINLYKNKNGNYYETVFVKTIAKGQNLKFDYKNYWKKYYKELL